MTEGSFEGLGGLRIFTRAWRPATQPRAVVLISHGFNSHSGEYSWVAEQLVADGYAVYALDLRGRGKSDGERFYVETVRRLHERPRDARDAGEVARAGAAGVPARPQRGRRGRVPATRSTTRRSSPGSSARASPTRCPRRTSRWRSSRGSRHVAPHAHVLKLKNEDFSRDPAVVAAKNADPLIANESQPTETVAEMVRADERLKKEFPHITLPVLIIHGTADKATKPAAARTSTIRRARRTRR